MENLVTGFMAALILTILALVGFRHLPNTIKDMQFSAFEVLVIVAWTPFASDLITGLLP